jgi:hypothetical protein
VADALIQLLEMLGHDVSDASLLYTISRVEPFHSATGLAPASP